MFARLCVAPLLSLLPTVAPAGVAARVARPNGRTEPKAGIDRLTNSLRDTRFVGEVVHRAACNVLRCLQIVIAFGIRRDVPAGEIVRT
jgi:hypothetical protein